MTLGAENGKGAAARTERVERVNTSGNWAEENRQAIDEYNAYVEEHGLVLARYRRF